MNKVLIFGSFDFIHPGHISLINEAKKYGEVHAVVVLDDTILKIKQRPPFHPIAGRIAELSRHGVTVHAGDAKDKLKVFKEVKPDTVVLGYDQHTFVEDLKSYIVARKLPTQIVETPSFHPELFKSRKIRAAAEDPAAGFVLIDKPSGEPSLHTVTALRKITGVKRIGFAGTLDPLASGLLVCGIAHATSLIDWWHFFPKTYEATMRLGVTSDTYDSEGMLADVSSEAPTEVQLSSALSGFLGASRQTPPMYSAKKVEGTKLYELARKGIEVERSARPITIHSIDLRSYAYPEATFMVTCSSGTYVRSLIHDTGKQLGTGAVMTALRRTAMGPYSVEAAVPVRSLTPETWHDHRIDFQKFRENLASNLFP